MSSDTGSHLELRFRPKNEGDILKDCDLVDSEDKTYFNIKTCSQSGVIKFQTTDPYFGSEFAKVKRGPPVLVSFGKSEEFTPVEVEDPFAPAGGRCDPISFLTLSFPTSPLIDHSRQHKGVGPPSP
jgi:hypothetical protein